MAGGPNVYFTTWGQVAQVMSKQLGVTVTYVVPLTPTYDPSVEVSTIDSLVAQGYNAFAIFPDGESAIISTYQRLVDRGIPVFDLAGCTTDPRDRRVGVICPSAATSAWVPDLTAG